MISYIGEQVVEVREAPGNHYFPIRPHDIDTNRLEGTFEEHEVERNVGTLLLLCQHRGGWYPFTYEELAQFCLEIGGNPKGVFRGLLGCWIHVGYVESSLHLSHPCLVIGKDGMFALTNHFIKRCAGHYRGQESGGVETRRVYYRIVLARGKDRVYEQCPYNFPSSGEIAANPQMFAEEFAKRMNREYGYDANDPDKKLWVAAIEFIDPQPIYQNPRLRNMMPREG